MKSKKEIYICIYNGFRILWAFPAEPASALRPEGPYGPKALNPSPSCPT